VTVSYKDAALLVEVKGVYTKMDIRIIMLMKLGIEHNPNL
jgi:hypothetical protein